MSYQQGDIIWVDYQFTDGTQTKVRPAQIISNSKVNVTGDYLLIQITSVEKDDGLSIEITETDFQSTPLEIKSFVRFHKIFLLLQSLILRRKTSVKSEFRKKVTDSVASIIA